jgi:hypothetical protein
MEPAPPPPAGPRRFTDLPPDVQRELLRRQAVDEAETIAAEHRYARRRLRGVIIGTVAALVVAPFLGTQPAYFPFLMTVVGGAAAFLVVRKECEGLGGAVIYGGTLVAFTLVAHFAGLIRMSGVFAIMSLFGWAALVGVGGLIGFLAESDRGLYLP